MLEKCLKQQGLKGTPYNLLVGDARRMSRIRREAPPSMPEFSHDFVPHALPFLHQTLSTYGKNSYTWMGPLAIVNITEMGLVREALTKVFEFSKPQTTNPLAKLLLPSLISYEGTRWAQHRKLINTVFGLSKLKLLMEKSFYTSCAEMVNKWEKLVNSKGSCEVDVRPYMESMSADAIARATFGDTCKEGTMVFKLLEEQTAFAARMIESIYIPGSRVLPTKTNRRMKELQNEIQVLLQQIVSARKKVILGEGIEADAHSTRHDFLSTLLESTTDEQQLVDDCKLFYFAGKDSTSKLLIWTMILLSKHQDWQVSAREEILSTFGHTNPPDFDGLGQLKIVNMILHEVLRLYPVAPKVMRYVPKETKLGHLTLPEGTLLYLPIVVVHHDPEVWGEDVTEFKPERFSQGVQQAAKSGKPSLLAFSTGPRNCVGQNYALIQAKLVLAMILQRFSFELSPSYVHAPYINLSLQPKFGAPIILRRL